MGTVAVIYGVCKGISYLYDMNIAVHECRHLFMYVLYAYSLMRVFSKFYDVLWVLKYSYTSIELFNSYFQTSNQSFDYSQFS